MDPPDSDAMGIDPPEPTAAAQDADSSSAESKTVRLDIIILISVLLSHPFMFGSSFL